MRCGPVFLISVLVLQDDPKKRFLLEGTAGSCRMGCPVFIGDCPRGGGGAALGVLAVPGIRRD